MLPENELLLSAAGVHRAAAIFVAQQQLLLLSALSCCTAEHRAHQDEGAHDLSQHSVAHGVGLAHRVGTQAGVCGTGRLPGAYLEGTVGNALAGFSEGINRPSPCGGSGRQTASMQQSRWHCTAHHTTPQQRSTAAVLTAQVRGAPQQQGADAGAAALSHDVGDGLRGRRQSGAGGRHLSICTCTQL